MTRTAEMADVVLPGSASWCEAEGTVTNSERRVQRVRKALDPPGEARDDTWIIAELARRLGHDWGEPTRRGGLGRAAVALADAPRHALRPPRGAGRAPVAVSRRGPPGLAVPARAPVGEAASRGRRRRSASSSASRRSRRSTPSTRSGSRPAGGSSRTTRACRRTSTARRSTAASRSTSRPRTPSGWSSRTARSSRSRRGAARSRRRCGSTRRCVRGSRS